MAFVYSGLSHGEYESGQSECSLFCLLRDKMSARLSALDVLVLNLRRLSRLSAVVCVRQRWGAKAFGRGLKSEITEGGLGGGGMSKVRVDGETSELWCGPPAGDFLILSFLTTVFPAHTADCSWLIQQDGLEIMSCTSFHFIFGSLACLEMKYKMCSAQKFNSL